MQRVLELMKGYVIGEAHNRLLAIFLERHHSDICKEWLWLKPEKVKSLIDYVIGWIGFDCHDGITQADLNKKEAIIATAIDDGSGTITTQLFRLKDYNAGKKESKLVFPKEQGRCQRMMKDLFIGNDELTTKHKEEVLADVIRTCLWEIYTIDVPFEYKAPRNWTP